MPKSWVCACGARNNWLDTNCEACGRLKGSESADETPTKAKSCPVKECLGELRYDGLCSAGNGYPEGMSCPIVCPSCHGKLTWSGICYSSHAWDQKIIPGDRYDLEKGHWVLTEKGPRKMFLREQNQRAIQVVGSVYKGDVSEEEGHRLIDRIARG